MKGYKYFREIVKALTKYDRFILYGKDKKPFSAWIGKMCDATNPCSWASFEKAYSVYMSDTNKYAGIGYCLDSKDDIVCIDIDHCIDADGKLNEVASDILAHVTTPTYIEVSLSGTGLHIFVKGRKETTKCRKGSVEVYSGGRYIALTALPLYTETGLVDAAPNQELIDYTCSHYLGIEDEGSATVVPNEEFEELPDDVIIEKAMNAKNSEKFKALYEGDMYNYNSPSEADLAFMDLLAFWCRKNPEQMKRIFFNSGRNREKTQRPDIITGLINKAILSCDEVYSGKGSKSKYDVIDDTDWSGSPFTNEEIDEAIKKLDPFYNVKYSSLDELSISLIYGDIFGKRLCYVLESSKWAFFNGKKFMMDSKNTVMVNKAIKHISSRLHIYLESKQAKFGKNDSSFKKLENVIKKITSASYRSKLEADLRERNPICITRFDEDRKLFNCKNGILNLETLDLLPHNSEFLISKESGVEYNPEAKCPLFEKTVSEIMDQNQDKIRFLRMALGSSLLGFNSTEKMYILWGPTTRNGKSTITECIHFVLGEYGCNIEPETLAQAKKDSRSASGDIARLRGMRYVQAAEPNKNMIFDVALIKRLTGNDTITARNLFESEFEFMPTFITFMNTNYLPKVMDTTLFASDRVRVIPFDHHFSEEERDSQLKQKLKTESSGILNWLLAGMRDFLENPYFYPDVIKKATSDYEAESDKTGQFLSEVFEQSEDSKMRGKEVYFLYRTWCEDNGFKIEGKTTLYKELKKKGYLYATSTFKGRTEHNIVIGLRQIEEEFQTSFGNTPFTA